MVEGIVYFIFILFVMDPNILYFKCLFDVLN
jgi:hypothetical protein